MSSSRSYFAQVSSDDNDADDDFLRHGRSREFLVPVYRYEGDLRVPVPGNVPSVLFWTSRASSQSLQPTVEFQKTITRRYGPIQTLHEVKTDSKEYRLFVVTQSPAEKYLFLDFLGKIYCLRVQSKDTKELLTFLTEWFSIFKLSSESTLQCFSSGKPISISDLCKLPTLSTVHVAYTTPVTWVFDFQCTPMLKHNITLTRLRKDTLADIKYDFLRALKTGYEIQPGASPREVWLIHEDAVLTEHLLQKMLGWSFAWPSLSDIDIAFKGDGCIPLRHETSRKSHVLTEDLQQNIYYQLFPWPSPSDIDIPFRGDGCIPLRHETSRKSHTFKVHVCFQPEDAIPKCLFLKKPLKEVLKRNKMTIVIPRDVTHEQMRLQIATALGQKRGALRITLGRQPLEEVADLQKQLCSATSHLWVTIQSPIALTLCIEDHPSGFMTRNTLHFYSADTIQDVKSEVGGLMNVPSYQIDLTYHEGQSLPEKESIQSCGIQTGEEIYASVREKRVILKLLFLGDKKSAVNVLINDIEKTNIRALKRFSKIVMPAFQSLLDSEILAILQNKVHSDSETLSEAGVSRESTPQKIVLKASKSLCFSAASATPNGTFITFQDDGKGGFKELYTTAAGKHLFIANIKLNQGDRSILLSGRRDVRRPQTIKGINVWPDKPSTEMRCPHSSSRTARPSEVTVQNQRLNREMRAGSCTVSCQTSQQDLAASAEMSKTTQESHGRAVDSASHQTCAGGMAARIDLDVPGTAQRKEGSQRQNNLEDRGGIIRPLEGMSSNSTTVQDTQSNNEPDHIQARGSEGHTLQTTPHCPDAISSPQATNSGPRTRQAAEILQEPRPSTSRKRSVDEVTDDCDSTERMLAKRKKSTGQSAETKKQQTLKRTVIEDSREESEIEGTVELKRTVSTSLFVKSTDATDAHMALMQTRNDAHVWAAELSLAHEEQAIWHDAKFKYIDKKIILAVAKELGKDGHSVILGLGVSYSKFQELEAKYGICSINCHLECLIEWCKKSGEKANPDTLKKVLADNDRNDLVEVVDILSGKTGYKTC